MLGWVSSWSSGKRLCVHARPTARNGKVRSFLYYACSLSLSRTPPSQPCSRTMHTLQHYISGPYVPSHMLLSRQHLKCGSGTQSLVTPAGYTRLKPSFPLQIVHIFRCIFVSIYDLLPVLDGPRSDRDPGRWVRLGLGLGLGLGSLLQG